MVAASDVSAVKPPALSYAERAKKAQNIRSPISAPSHRAVSQPASSLPTASDMSTASSTSSSTFSSFATKSNSTTTSTNITPSSSIILATRPPSPSLHTADFSDVKIVNGEPLTATASNTQPPPVATTQPPPQKSSVVNVWNVRKEQMAARARLPQASSSQSIQPASISPSHSRSSVGSVPPSSRPLDPVSTAQGPLSTNGTSPTIDTPTEDPFVVRMPNRPQPSSALENDEEHWPEVGKAVPSFPSTPTTEALNDDEEPSKESEGLNSGVPPRKSEKTKWVPIPAEELQAAADAALKPSTSRQSHSRNHSQSANSRPPRHTHNNQNGSGSSSRQDQSRTQSGQNSISHSLAQSRVQSRTGSVTSSPLQPRGRRLPSDDGLAQAAFPTATESFTSASGSAENSPRIQRPSLPQNFLDPNINGHSSYNSMYGSAPIQIPNYYAPQPHAAQDHQQHPYAHRSSHSPHHIPYSLPPQAFGPAPTYPMYPTQYPHNPYDGPNQPYTYWNPHNNGSGHHTPPYPHQYGFPPPPMPQQYPNMPINMGQIPDPSIGHPPAQAQDVSNPRPPPPDESQAMTELNHGHREDGARGQHSHPPAVVFGSIEVEGASHAASPPLAHIQTPAGQTNIGVGETQKTGEEGSVEKPFAGVFSIGVQPGEAGPSRVRSRTRSNKGKADSGTGVEVSNGDVGHGGDGDAARVTRDVVVNGDATGSDLTDQEKKWEFGTAGRLDDGVEKPEGWSLSDGGLLSPLSAVTAPFQQQHLPPDFGGVIPPQQVMYPFQHEPTNPPVSLSHSLTVPPLEGSLPLPPSMPTDIHTGRPLMSTSVPIAGPEPVLSPVDGKQFGPANEWEVRDYGFGFGHASGSGYAVALTQVQRAAREQDRIRERDIERDQRVLEEERLEREQVDLLLVQAREKEYERERENIRLPPRDMDYPPHGGRPRRGSQNGGFYDRGGFGGRRGRGFGRGNRNFHNRGGYSYNNQSSRPFTLTPPPNFQPLMPPLGDSNGYYPPPSQQLTTYIPTGFEGYQPPQPMHGAPATASPVAAPVPTPLSSLSFPLDPTRFYLLGQLEYYLSPQNMAKDFFLRQRMDSRGWIPIALIASFNRVQRLTMDIQLVREMLSLSSIVQVMGDWVRMGNWEQYILPGAVRSTIEGLNDDNHTHWLAGSQVPMQMAKNEEPTSTVNEGEGDDGDADEVEDDDEEDVVFVMGEAGR